MPIATDLLRGGAFAFTVKAVGAGLAFALNIVIAQMTDPATYGIFVFTLGWVALAALGMRLGLDTLVVRLVASYRTTPEQIPAVITWAYKRLLVQTGVVLLLAALTLIATRSSLSDTQFTTLLFAAPLLIVVSWNSITQSIVQGFGRATALVPDQVIRPGVFLAILGVWMLFVRLSPTSVQLILASALAGTVALSVSSLWSRRLVGTDVQAQTATEPKDHAWGRGLTPLFLITGASVLLSQTDVLLLGILGDDASVGIYAAAGRIVVLVTFALTAINTVLAPMIANLWRARELPKLQSLVLTGVRISFGISIVLSAGLWIGAEAVMSLFGTEFVAAVPALQILLIGHVVNAFVGSVGVIQMMTGHERAAALFMGIAVVVNILLNLLLIPQYGIIGAAISTACATTLWNICGAIFVRRKLGIRSTAL